MLPKVCTNCGYTGLKPNITGITNLEEDILSLSLGCLICIFGDEAVKFINKERQ